MSPYKVPLNQTTDLYAFLFNRHPFIINEKDGFEWATYFPDDLSSNQILLFKVPSSKQKLANKSESNLGIHSLTSRKVFGLQSVFP